MNLFHGVHEVRLLRPNGVAVGYYDSWNAALLAVENEPSQYKAAYFTLNPLNIPKVFSHKLNPQSLTPGSNTAGASDVARRVWLLVDLDPPRPPHTNSTDSRSKPRVSRRSACANISEAGIGRSRS